MTTAATPLDDRLPPERDAALTDCIADAMAQRDAAALVDPNGLPPPEIPPGSNARTDGLANRAFRGGLVTLSAQGVKFVLHLTSVAIFARLLAPAEHGLVNMTTAFTGFALLFKDLGLGGATVQAKTVDQRQLSVIFWLMVVISTVVAVIIFALAPAVAWFYSEPRVMPIMMALSGSVILGGLSSQHQALLRRNMRFKALAQIDVGSMIIGVAAGAVAAVSGMGSWALVIMVFGQAISTMILSWIFSPWRPSFSFQLSGTREMMRFGGYMTAFNVLNYAVRNVDNIIIGRFYGAATLGLYAKAYQLLVLPINQLTGPIANVAHPALCRLHGAGHSWRWRRYYLNALTMVAALTTPLVMFSFVMADQIIVGLLGPQWAAATPLYRALAGAALVDTVNVASGWAFMSTGRTDRMFRWQCFETTMTLIAFAIGIYWGPMGIAIAFSIVRASLRLPLLAYCYRTAPITLRMTLRALRLPVGASVFASLVIAVVHRFLYIPSAGPFVQLLMAAMLFVPCYAACWLAFPSGRALCTEAFALVRTSLFNRNLRRAG